MSLCRHSGRGMRRAKPSKAARKRTRAQRPAKRPRKAAPSGKATEAALAAFAHEVRTPLTGILALSELLAPSDRPERERGGAAAVKSAAEHLAQLTTLVVGGTKAATRGPALRREPMRPRALAEALAATLTARAETKGLATEVRVGALPDAAVGDAVLLRAAVENLIDNAVNLTERGHKVDFASTGAAAVEAVARGGYDLVLMDVILPDVDGIEATRRIRALAGDAARTPIVGISGRAAPGDEAAARTAGMDAYVMKPVSPSRLAEVISAAAR